MLNFNEYKHRNQYVAIANGCAFFKSYNSLIAFVNMAKKEVVLGDDWNYSKTTLRHLNAFLNDFYMAGRYFTKENEKRIKDGTFVKNQAILENLLDAANTIKQ